MRKLNNRPIFFACVSLGFGIVLSSYQNVWKILAVLLIFSAMTIAVYKLLQNGDGLPRTFTALIMLGFFVVGISAGFAQQIIYENKFTNQSGAITCEITEVSSSQFVGKNILVNNVSQPGKVLVAFENSSEYNVGDVVEFVGELKQIPIFENGAINYQFSSGVQYRTQAETIGKSHHVFNPKSYIKNSVWEAMENLFGENAGISYAMMFGDSTLVDYSSLSILRRGGVAHIFAVSGLHIGILFGVLKMFSWIKLRSSLKQKDAFNILCICILLFYVYLCDFTASSMRAFLMIFVGMVLTRQGACKDRLNTISISAFILLLYSPYIIFTVGFQLSFLAVFGLVVFPRKLANLFGKMADSRIIKALSFAISAFISTALVACFHFGYLSTISVLLNLLVVPIYSLVYVANLCGVALYFVCSALSAEHVISAICPYFTNAVYDQTILLFGKIDKFIPLALDVAIPLGVLIGVHGVMYINSGLVSSQVARKKKIQCSAVFLLACVIPFGVSLATPNNSYVEFYGTETQPLTIAVNNETFLFCKSGGEIDFSNVETSYASVIIYDEYYRNVKTSGGENLEISIYCDFYQEKPNGTNTLGQFKNASGKIEMKDATTYVYEGVEFHLGKEYVTVKFGGEEYKIETAGKRCYAMDGVLTTNKSYKPNNR